MEKKNKKKINELCKFSFFLFLFLFLSVKMFILVDIFRTGSRKGEKVFQAAGTVPGEDLYV